MTDLTLESLEQDIKAMITPPADLKQPTKLIVPRSVFRYLMWRPQIRKAGSTRKRKQAVSWRKRSVWQNMIAKS